MKEAIVDIKMNPHRPKKPASDESTSDEEEMIVYDVEDEIESNPDYVKENVVFPQTLAAQRRAANEVSAVYWFPKITEHAAWVNKYLYEMQMSCKTENSATAFILGQTEVF
ncbi:hypothetical protein TNCV_321211 [Trichonephila clavipes]|nr:hypothetical protein TNCV_321211 [Trichonephila clavipes]